MGGIWLSILFGKTFWTEDIPLIVGCSVLWGYHPTVLWGDTRALWEIIPKVFVVSLDIFSILYSKMVSFHSTPKTLAHSEDLESANSVLKIRPIVNLILVGFELGCQIPAKCVYCRNIAQSYYYDSSHRPFWTWHLRTDHDVYIWDLKDTCFVHSWSFILERSTGENVHVHLTQTD